MYTSLLLFTFLFLIPTSSAKIGGGRKPNICPDHVQLGTNKITFCNVSQRWEPRLAQNTILFFSWLPIILNFAWIAFLSWATAFRSVAKRSRYKYQRYLKFLPSHNSITYQKIGTFILEPTPVFRAWIFVIKWFYMPFIIMVHDILCLGFDSYYYYKMELTFHTILHFKVIRNGYALDAMMVFTYIGLAKNVALGALIFGSLNDLKGQGMDRMESDGHQDYDDDLPIVIINERLGRRVPGRESNFGDSLYILSEEERIRFGLVPEEHEGEFTRPPKTGPRPMQLKRDEIDPNIDMSLEAIRTRNVNTFTVMAIKKGTFIYPAHCVMSLVCTDCIQLFLQFFFVEKYIVMFDWSVTVRVTLGAISGIVGIIFNLQFVPYQMTHILTKKLDMVFFLLLYISLGLKSVCNIIRFVACWIRGFTGVTKANCYTLEQSGFLRQTPFAPNCLATEDWIVLVLIWITMVLAVVMITIQYRQVSRRVRLYDTDEEEVERAHVVTGPAGETIPGGRREGHILVIPDSGR